MSDSCFECSSTLCREQGFVTHDLREHLQRRLAVAECPVCVCRDFVATIIPAPFSQFAMMKREKRFAEYSRAEHPHVGERPCVLEHPRRLARDGPVRERGLLEFGGELHLEVVHLEIGAKR